MKILEAHGLKVFDVEELLSHGGSLRVFACRDGSADPSTSKPSVARVIENEKEGRTGHQRKVTRFLHGR